MRSYNSFEDIDKDLRYLHLQKQIDKETMKLNLSEVKESFSVVGVVTNIIGSIAKKAVILKAVNKLIGKK